uniref:Putative ribonuclease H-like domain-containing protein n=1 Tax=Tanacetum cinerariifolium TaxID=118510 RepID=A0A699HAV8_TANCI|nr:putative ribonuclease H-like domain-containing protein [Tanacetum cinerariifolium]
MSSSNVKVKIIRRRKITKAFKITTKYEHVRQSSANGKTKKRSHVYVDDIIFGSTKKSLCDEFEQIMHNRFKMSSMGELTFFLGLQVQQKEDGIFINQDNDYVGASLDRKSTKGGCQFLGSRLISWQCKNQTVVANSTTEAEYIAASHRCGQVLWIQNQMMDYRYNFMHTRIHVVNESAICVIKNPFYHSKTKHIKIRHHFIRDSYKKRLIEMVKIHTDNNVVDLLTKAFDVGRFNFLVASIVKNGLKKNMYHHTAKTDNWETSKEVEALRYLRLMAPLKKVGDEAVHKELGDRMERAATTASSLEAEQDSEFSDKRNMVAYLEKSEGSEGFHQVIDFLSASHIKYALTKNPTIYASLIEQFWQTAALSIIKDGVMAITATIYRNVKVLITEASIKVHLKLGDSEGLGTLFTEEIF